MRMKKVFAELYIGAVVAAGAACLVAASLWVKVVVAAVNAFTPQPKPFRKAAFNFGQLSISTTLAATTYGLVGGKTAPTDLTSTILAVAVSAAVYFLANSTFTAAVIVLPLGVAWYSFKLYVSRSNESIAESAKMHELNRLFEQSNTRLAETH